MKYKDTLREYLENRVKDMNSYIDLFNHQKEVYADSPEVIRYCNQRIEISYELRTELQKIISYCERRGRF